MLDSPAFRVFPFFLRCMLLVCYTRELIAQGEMPKRTNLCGMGFGARAERWVTSARLRDLRVDFPAEAEGG